MNGVEVEREEVLWLNDEGRGGGPISSFTKVDDVDFSDVSCGDEEMKR